MFLIVTRLRCIAVAILDGRQKRAEELRRLTDQSASMSEDQLSELRADIKVSPHSSISRRSFTLHLHSQHSHSEDFCLWLTALC